MKSFYLTTVLLLTLVFSHAQKNVFLSIDHQLGDNSFALNQADENDLQHKFVITRLNYYISSIKIIHDGGLVTSVDNKYILAKGNSKVLENLGSFDVTNVEGIRFSIGVEAPTNNADPSLQPTGSPLGYQNPSMHWGWSSGYRFIALEGKSGNSLNTTFQLHGLWNANYFEQTQMAAGEPTGANDIYISLDADITQALKGINLNAGPIEHGSNGADLTALKNFQNYVFTPSANTPSSVEDVEDHPNVIVYPNPTTENIFIDFSHSLTQVDEFKIIDIFGRIALSNLLNSNEIDISSLAKGPYILQLYNENTIVAHKKILVK